jgi:uncharacterized membrane protein
MASFVGTARPHSNGRRQAQPGSPRPGGSDRAEQLHSGFGAGRPSLEQLADGLGYFSLGLGFTQMLSPTRVNRLIGVRDDPKTRLCQRVVGLQELAAGAGILLLRRPTPWLWSRTAGDVLHLGMLMRAFRGRRESAPRLAAAIGAVMGCLATDAFAATRSTQRQSEEEDRMLEGHASITICADAEELVERWRSFEQDPDSGSRLGPIEVVEEQPLRIEWRTKPGAPEQLSGVTRFGLAPAGRGTEIHVRFEFDIPGGAVGQAVKKVAGDDPQQLVRDDLRRLKQLVETGEIVRSEGAPSGSSASDQPKQRPAQPLEPAIN